MENCNNKKIVILGPAFPFRGGLANYNERLAREYQKQGYEVTIFTFILQYPKFLFPGKTQYSEEKAPENLDIKIALNSINPFSWIKVGLQIKKIKPKLLIIKFWMPFMAPCLGTVARIVKRNNITKIVSIVDNIIPHEKRFGDTLLSKYFAKSVDGFIVMSKSVLNDLETLKIRKPKIFSPHPVYDNFGEQIPKLQAKNTLKLNPENKYILFFGFIRDYKGLDLLLQAMADQRIKQQNIKLIIAGEFYNDEQQYKDIIEKLDLKSSLVMATNFIPDSKVATYFCASDLVVQPYKTATQSGVTQIAYHFEKPMLVTNVGGLPEIVLHHKTGYVVDINPINIADAIIDFYENNREIDFVENCKQEKKKYLWSTMLEKIDELFL